MPIQKFRSVADMPPPPRKHPGDPALYRAMAGLWELGRRLRPPRRFPAGVHRHRSIESMNQQRDDWDTAYFQTIRSSRQ
jgi:hypothetical protein